MPDKQGRQWSEFFIDLPGRGEIFLGAALVLLVAVASSSEAAEPRPISPAERAAVAVAAQYLGGNATAWSSALARGSEWSELSAADRTAEVDVRVGPAEGAVWQLTTATRSESSKVVFSVLYPSGLEELLVFEMEEEGDTWRVGSIVSSVDLRAEPLDFETLFDEASAPAPGGHWRVLPALLGAAILSCFLLVAESRLRAAWPACFGAAVLILLSCTTSQDVIEVAGEEEPRLGELRDLRWSTAGVEVASPKPPPEGSQLAEVASIWEAESLILGSQLNAAEEILDSLETPSRYLRAELLRARLARRRGRHEAALDSFARAEQLAGAYDVLAWERVQTQATMGEPQLALANALHLAEQGSRSADVHYVAAAVQLGDDQADEAEASFRTAWNLEPRGRETLFGDPSLAILAARPTLFPLLELHSSLEPVVRQDDTSRAPLEWPEGSHARLYGRRLVVAVGTGSLDVPNGAALAPAAVAVRSAGSREKDEEHEALDWLEGSGVEALAAAGPLERRRGEVAGRALLRDERWTELLELTEVLASIPEETPAELAWLQASALRGLGRHHDAKVVLIELGKRGVVERQRDPALLVELAELFAQTEDFDTAVRLLKRASVLTESRALNYRIRQLVLDKRLADNYESHRTGKFEIRYPRATGKKYVVEIAYVLEEELKRLQRWIPASDEVIEVNLFPLASFVQSYGQDVLVLGLFDGRVRVPFADLRSLHPSLVAVLSHELAHAMIADRSKGRAPEWFHEGLAQHIQMADQRTNDLALLRESSRTIALSALSPIIRGLSEVQFVDLAYGQAAWWAHYLEARGGAGVFARMMDAFAAGLDTKEALRRVLRAEPEDIEQAFWDWGASRAPRVWPTTLRRYDEEMVHAELRGAHPGASSSRKQSVGRGRMNSDTVEVRAAAMRRWHRLYLSKVAGVKRSLGAVLSILDGKSEGEVSMACRSLETQLVTLLADDEAFSSPDRAINTELKRAFGDFQSASVACQGVSLAATRRAISRGEAKLGKVARRLAPYGLRP